MMLHRKLRSAAGTATRASPSAMLKAIQIRKTST